jgi:putative endonuclease
VIRQAPHHLAVGQAAEDAACRYLEYAGYVVVTRNFRTRQGELDIVAVEDGVLAIIEVRYRSRNDFGGAAASVTRAKRARLVRAAQGLLMRYPRLARLPARFDVVEVDGEPEKLNCRLIRAAFSL